jgi:hypothetical protein
LAADAQDRVLKHPDGVRQHLIDRMRDRAITIADLNQLRVRIESKPEVPEGDWYKDFGSVKICGNGSYPKTFLLRGQAALNSSFSQNARVQIGLRTDENGKEWILEEVEML